MAADDDAPDASSGEVLVGGQPDGGAGYTPPSLPPLFAGLSLSSSTSSVGVSNAEDELSQPNAVDGFVDVDAGPEEDLTAATAPVETTSNNTDKSEQDIHDNDADEDGDESPPSVEATAADVESEAIQGNNQTLPLSTMPTTTAMNASYSRAATPVHSNNHPSRAATPVHANYSVPSIQAGDEGIGPSDPTSAMSSNNIKDESSSAIQSSSTSSSSSLPPRIERAPPKNTKSIPRALGSTKSSSATKSTSTTTTTSSTIITTSTRVPHPDTALRLLRKFYIKSSPSIPQSAGGTRPSSWFGWVFGSSVETAGRGERDHNATMDNFSAYKAFSMAMEMDKEGVDGSKDGGGDDRTANATSPSSNSSSGGGGGGSNTSKDGDAIIESILGHRGDSPSKARKAMASFIQLLDTWSHSSARHLALLQELEAMGKSTSGVVADTNGGGVVTDELLALCIDTASGLVAHGCLDELYLMMGGASSAEEEGVDGRRRRGNGGETGSTLEQPHDDGNNDDGDELLGVVGAPSLIKKGVNMLVESICIADLSTERTELAALKFLLTAGCRTTTIANNNHWEATDQTPPSSVVMEPMLRGTHLLQTIRVCSQIYLHTEVESNKTTAKAALQQLVVTVFVRLERTIERCKLEDQLADTSSGAEASALVGGETIGKKHADSASLNAAPTFPTQDHRDAYLVLRSLCKLSMQTSMTSHPPPAPAPVVMTTTGRSAAGSIEGTTAPATTTEREPAHTSTPVPTPPPPPAVIPGSSYDPTFASRILALQLLLHILRHSSSRCLLHAGPQFHYAIRQYLCTSLLKNATSLETNVVELSLRLFVPLVRNFRSLLKNEIEAFVTNVFFVILDSKNSTVQHKLLVVTLFEEICADATTLAEIFLNYDCDLSAVDLFSRIVNALGKVARVGLSDATGSSLGGGGGVASSTLQFVVGAGAARAEMTRLEHRELRLAAMKALRQVLASLHSSIVTPVYGSNGNSGDISLDEASLQLKNLSVNGHHEKVKAVQEGLSADSMKADLSSEGAATVKKTLVEMYDSKKRRREEESQAALKFNQKPTDGLKYAAERGHLDLTDPVDVARYLLQNKDTFEKAQIGEYLGREKEWQDGFALKVLRAYGDALDFQGMKFDDAIRYYLSGFRLPGEAQKIDRIMEVFAARYTEQNADVFPSADSAFILAFSIIMLNTDLHNPAIREDRKMTIASFIRMNSGVCEGGDFPDEMLTEIFERIKNDPISLKDDDNARERLGIGKDGKAATSSSTTGLSELFFGSHYVEQDKTRESNYRKEGDQIVRDTESMLRRRRKATKQHTAATSSSSSKKAFRDNAKKHVPVKFVGTADSGLRDEYVTPMFDVAWGPALAVFSTAIESANGTDGILASIATDEEMDHAVENAASAIDVSLNGFQLAICIAGLCGNNTARDAYVRALYNFTLLGSSHLLADRHIQCVLALLRLGRDDGELLDVTWEHIFRALTDIYRLHQVWEGMARNERKEVKGRKRAARKAEKELTNSTDDGKYDDDSDSSSEASDVRLEDEMDKRMIDEANAIFIHDTIPLDLVDSIFQRSTSLSRRALKDFVYQLCRVSRMEISGYGGHVGSNANDIDLTNDHYMKHHTLMTATKSGSSSVGVGATQPAIYSLEKLVEVTHFNMESRPRLIFADIWGTISTHLTSTALHEEAAVAMYAVDSLRQLSLQFLNREELGIIDFQRRFLKPFEIIMARSMHVTVKELLLSSVEQIVALYGFGDESKSSTHKGTLRSGWRSILNVLGSAGLDKNDSIAHQGFKMLCDQVDQCISVCATENGGSLATEYFVDLVNTLLLFFSGPRQDLSSESTVRIVQLSDVLAEGRVPVSSSRKTAPLSPVALSVSDVESDGYGELELWWPLLLGLSKTMGDRRPEIRVKGLGTLLDIIHKHFFPSSGSAKVSGINEGEYGSSPRHGDLQTLQLIFRGILVPALEFEEMDGNSTSGFAPELLPDKFVYFITIPPAAVESAASGADRGQQDWINTTFEYLIDGCVSICLKSLESFKSDSLVEEVLAMLNSCLLSDSGHLAVKGLRRLQQFVSKDLELKDISDDTWATVSHMLFRVLSIRGLPPPTGPDVEGATEEEIKQLKEERIETMNEFIREQRYFSNRRYIGCNAAMVIGSLLTDKSIVESMGVQWYIFLTSGLGKGIREWERAAAMIDAKTEMPDAMPSPPHYLENVLYARRWMTKFLVGLLSQSDVSTLLTAPCQQVLKEECNSLLRGFLAKELNECCSVVEMRNISKMVSTILECFNALSDDKIAAMKWLSPLLSACIQTNNQTIRTSVQILITRLLKDTSDTSED
ncbi:hypothetical protein ACHAWU_003496 [Discostella pseudostelligera]|uniref:SEC7 domain-containing protein n=1 Tax=Discostella pseudostelligera TaxID=259834 RepID=A0ABD3M1Y4_9STRA